MLVVAALLGVTFQRGGGWKEAADNQEVSKIVLKSVKTMVENAKVLFLGMFLTAVTRGK